MMETRYSLDELSLSAPVVLAAGMFDGIHLGHQSLLAEGREQARKRGGSFWVLTFDRHPARVLRPEQAPPLLQTANQRLAGFEQEGADGCFFLPFTTEFARTPPGDFLDRLHLAIPTLTLMIVGSNWRFGRDAAGDIDLLRVVAREKGFEVSVPSPVMHDGAMISSTRIRDAVLQGRLRDAYSMLGRPYTIDGSVGHGRKRGRNLGFPTANVRPDNDLIPSGGIYACRVRTGGQTYDAAGYIPREQDEEPLVEVHLLDYEGDLYETGMSVSFIDVIRNDDRRFERDDDLVRQIEQDIRDIRACLAKT